jgi:hypothetical protein
MEMLDSSLKVMDTRDVNATFETTSTNVYIHKSENEGDTMSGAIHSATCNWSQPYKNGKVIIIGDVQDEHENLKDVTITIEAVEGKITILLHAQEYPDKLIRLQVDKYEEKN